MHCARGHQFTLAASYRDAHGTWCPECGESAHSGPAATCAFVHERACKRCGADLVGRSETLHLMTDCRERRAARAKGGR